jgi:hypothetical protein
MSGQTLSKIWLCKELERTVLAHCPGVIRKRPTKPYRVWVLGGWYCLTNLLLRSRGNLPLAKVVSLDIDPKATAGACILNEAFIFERTFEAATADVNDLSYEEYGGRPDIVINTACEHMSDQSWFYNIPDGTIVALQSNDMKHEDHISEIRSEDDMGDEFPLEHVWMTGRLPFKYETWSFNRFMTIGVK